jgi:hypothetical protein
MIVIPVLLACSLSLAQTSQSPAAKPPASSPDGAPISREDIISAWEKGLNDICRVEKIGAMVFTIPGWEPMAPWKKQYGVPAMRILAKATRTAWFQIAGVQVFSFAQYDYANYEPMLFNLIRTLDPQTVKKAASEGLTLGELGNGSLDMDLLSSLVPDVAFGALMLDKGGNARIGMQLLPMIEYADPETGKTVRMTLPWAADGPTMTPPVGDSPLFPYTPLEPLSTQGPLDFGDGKVLSLKEMVAQAEEAFDTRYYLDFRLADTLVYVRGNMDKATFEKIYALVGDAQPPVERPARASLDRETLQAWLAQYADSFASTEQLHGMQPADFVEGKTMSAGDLASYDPALRTLFEGRGLSASTQVRLRMGVEFSLDPGGIRTSFPPQAAGGRGSVKYGVSNHMRFAVIGR